MPRTFISSAVCLLLSIAMTTAFAEANAAPPSNADTDWPPVTAECKPWGYWWWMGSAADRANITREMEAYAESGMGGLHIVPIYGAKGYEDRYVPHLSPEWMTRMSHAASEARRVGMDVDMTLGTGWCFGGPAISDRDANARVKYSVHNLQSGKPMEKQFDADLHEAVVAYGSNGEIIDDLLDRIQEDGRIDWIVPDGDWTLYVVWREPSGRKVKRAAPGGEGWMANPLSRRAIDAHLEPFTKAFDAHDGARPRAIYHDSYEYICDWAPELFEEFAERRGYRLEHHLPALFGKIEDDETCARVQYDYRRTISEMHLECFTQPYVDWAHERGMIVRNEAHGSPSNLLDTYGATDSPETELFREDGDVLFTKLSSSAAHVMGRKLVSSETCTWRNEHFHTTLADCKDMIDELFIGGVNHIFFHGTCYSPEEEAWPGWCFYASTQYNRRNSIWRDAPALNDYITRCQSVLQAGEPDNDVLLYWPIHDMWQTNGPLAMNLTVHSGWMEGTEFRKTAEMLWENGTTFDYVSDRQLAEAKADDGDIITSGGRYRSVIVPPCELMPLETLEHLLELAREGAKVGFLGHLPVDVPGLDRLEERRARLQQIAKQIEVGHPSSGAMPHVGRAFLPPEFAPVFTHQTGLQVVRRKVDGGHYLFLFNMGKLVLNTWGMVPMPTRSVVMMDPMTGKIGEAKTRPGKEWPLPNTLVRIQLQPGETIILRTFTDRESTGLDPWPYYEVTGEPIDVEAKCEVDFIQGGPVLPESFTCDKPIAWTGRGDADADHFAGTARYTLTFDAPDGMPESQVYRLDLGEVRDSCRVTLNGESLGALIGRRWTIDGVQLKPGENVLEVEVTNVAANRVRDLDIRGVDWKKFHDINIVNIDYKEFDASVWPVRPAGLLGPVRLVPLDVE